MRILLVSQPTVAGVAVVVRDLARAGVRAGHDVAVAGPADGRLQAWTAAAGARWIPLPLTRSPSPSDLRRIADLRRLVRSFDVVHLHSSKAGAVGRLALVGMSRRPACAFTPHGWSWLAGGRLSSPIYRIFERLAAPLADATIAVGDDELRAGADVLGRAQERVRVVQNGVDVTRFRPDGPRAMRSSAPLLTCVGRLARQKGQDVAVRALAASRHRDARLRLVGMGPERDDLVALAARLGVADRLELVGERSDPADELRTADVVLVPSRWEGLSLVLLEAMASGAAVVATAVAGESALGRAGVVVPPEDARALATAADALLENPRRRAELGRAARERAVARFAVERCLEATLTLWEELVRHRQAAGCGASLLP